MNENTRNGTLQCGRLSRLRKSLLVSFLVSEEMRMKWQKTILHWGGCACAHYAEAQKPNNAPLSVVMRRIPRFFRFDNDPSEATGLSLDAYTHGWGVEVLMMSSLFLRPPALMTRLTITKWRCTSKLKTLEYNGRVYIIHQSCFEKLTLSFSIGDCLGSIITALIFLALFGAIFFWGIIIHTPYRWQVGIKACILCAISCYTNITPLPTCLRQAFSPWMANVCRDWRKASCGGLSLHVFHRFW
jgi:hypothetical protein